MFLSLHCTYLHNIQILSSWRQAAGQCARVRQLVRREQPARPDRAARGRRGARQGRGRVGAGGLQDRDPRPAPHPAPHQHQEVRSDDEEMRTCFFYICNMRACGQVHGAVRPRVELGDGGHVLGHAAGGVVPAAADPLHHRHRHLPAHHRQGEAFSWLKVPTSPSLRTLVSATL